MHVCGAASKCTCKCMACRVFAVPIMKGMMDMGLTLTEKILKAHLVEGEMVKGSEIGIRIDQTLTQDATGTMAYLEFEAMGVPRYRTQRCLY